MQMWPVSIPYLYQFKDPIQRAPLLSKAVKQLTTLQRKHMESMSFQHFDLQTGSFPSFKAQINQVIGKSNIFNGDMDAIDLNILTMVPVKTGTNVECQEMQDDDENEREERQSSNTSSIKLVMSKPFTCLLILLLLLLLLLLYILFFSGTLCVF
ncbi:hypothetical protein LINGRAHAP2_LOCUS7296 [Linum grandiflorum]